VAADARRPSRLLSIAFGPARLHFAFGSAMSLRVLSILCLLSLAGCAHPTRPEADLAQGMSETRHGVLATQIKPLPSNSDGATPWVYVSREVRSPGRYTWVEGMTLTDLIEAAGGFTPFAGDRIRIEHQDGTRELHHYEEIRKHRKNDPLLRPGDKIWVVGALG
jgi:hypothetical protein